MKKKFDLTNDSSENVLGYFINNNDDSVPYDLHIQSDGVIYAPNDSTGLFAFSNVESIDGLDYVEFDETTKMTAMFKGNKKLKTIDTSVIDISNASDTSYMFNGCNELDVSEDDFNVENVSIKNNMFPTKITIVSGDYDTVGSEVCIDTECFYVISSTEDSVTMLAKYNLYVGGEYNERWVAYGEEATGMQDSTMTGYIKSQIISRGVTVFSSDEQKGINYSDYKGSIVETYVNNYNDIIENKFGINLYEIRLITLEELTNEETFACEKYGACSSTYPWIYSTSYWSQTVSDKTGVWAMCNNYLAYDGYYDYGDSFGVRPVITILKSQF